MKKAALMQPTFLPWLGFFELIARADVFVILDDFQFVYQSFGQRNRLFTNKDVVSWVTVPIDKKNCYRKSYREVSIREDAPWRVKLWKGLVYNYGKTAWFSTYENKLKPLLVEKKYNLAAQNIELILQISDILGLQCEFLYSSQLKSVGKRSAHLKAILEEVGADCYVSAHGSFAYMQTDAVFPIPSLPVYFQNANLKPYPQYGSSKGFVPYLSVLDALFNVGAEKTRDLIEHTTDHWLTWDEMLILEKKCGADEERNAACGGVQTNAWEDTP